MPGFFRDIGPCVLDYDNTEIGESFGGTRIQFDVQDVESFIDKDGVQAKDAFITGTIVGVTTLLTQATLAQLLAVIPGASMNGNALEIKSAVGTSEETNAVVLILKPIIGGEATADQSLWATFEKAYVRPDAAEYVFDNATQKVFQLRFRIFEGATGVLAKFGTTT